MTCSWYAASVLCLLPLSLPACPFDVYPSDRVRVSVFLYHSQSPYTALQNATTVPTCLAVTARFCSAAPACPSPAHFSVLHLFFTCHLHFDIHNTPCTSLDNRPLPAFVIAPCNFTLFCVNHTNPSPLFPLTRSDNVPRLHDFTARFTPRFCELMHDVSEDVAAAGLRLLALLVEHGILKHKVRGARAYFLVIFVIKNNCYLYNTCRGCSWRCWWSTAWSNTRYVVKCV